MSRTELNFILDTILLIVFSACFWVAGVLRYVFPPGPQAEGWLLWGRNFAWWTNVLFTLMSLFAVGIVLHVMLHWTWICGVVASRVAKDKKSKLDDGVRTLYGVGVLIVLLHILGIAFAAAYFTVRPPAM